MKKGVKRREVFLGAGFVCLYSLAHIAVGGLSYLRSSVGKQMLTGTTPELVEKFTKYGNMWADWEYALINIVTPIMFAVAGVYLILKMPKLKNYLYTILAAVVVACIVILPIAMSGDVTRGDVFVSWVDCTSRAVLISVVALTLYFIRKWVVKTK